MMSITQQLNSKSSYRNRLITLFGLLFFAFWASIVLPAGIATNEATDPSGIFLSSGLVTVETENNAVTSITAEISPTTVTVGAIGTVFEFDLLPVISGTDSGFNSLSITAPTDYANLTIIDVTVAGSVVNPGTACPTLAAGEYCASVVDQVMQVTLGSSVSTTLSNTKIGFSADIPDVMGSGDFSASIDDTNTLTIAAQNVIAGDADGDSDDDNSLTVIIAGDAVDSVVGEIDPARVTVNQQDRALSFFLMPTIIEGNTGFNNVTLTAPADSEFTDLQATQVIVNEVILIAGEVCPTLSSGQYCASSNGTDLTVMLGDKITSDQTRVQIDFTMDTPSETSNGDFTFSVDDTTSPVIEPQPGLAGESDGNADNANTLTVTTRLGTDPVLSTFIVNPIVVEADGESEAVLQITLLDANSEPLDGKEVTIVSDRGELVDTINYNIIGEKPHTKTQNQSTTIRAKSNSVGIIEARISSSTNGISTLTATDDDGVELLTKPQVYFNQGNVLQLRKRANKQKVVVGDVITYTIDIQNTVDREIILVQLLDKIPPNFKYHSGSARLGNKLLPDPEGERRLAFDIGTVPAMQDNNANGVADIGEAGSLSLSYQLIVGAGARPGKHLNQVFAVDICEFCQISNNAQASVEVVFDPLFDLGNIIGKVFNDRNGNGIQDEALSESGIANAMVVLDNGTYVFTDKYGRYHFPSVLPGERLLKINVSTLPKFSVLTTSATKVVKVTPGLLVKGNFGISKKSITEQQEVLGKKGKTAARLESSLTDSALQFVGSATQFTLLANGTEMTLPRVDVSLRNDTQQQQKGLNTQVLHYINNALSDPLSFVFDTNHTNHPKSIKNWQIDLSLPTGQVIRSIKGDGQHPKILSWDGMDENAQILQKNSFYFYQLTLNYADNSKARSALKLLSVERKSLIHLTLPEVVFVDGTSDLTRETRTLLQQAAQKLREFPQETLLIQGASPSTAGNMLLSQQRAKAAAHYLAQHHAIDNDRIELYWLGNILGDEKIGLSRRPIKTTELEEILNKVQQVPQVYLNDQALSVDELGRFSYFSDTVSSDHIWRISMTDKAGRSIETQLHMPTLTLTAPLPESWLEHGHTDDNYLVSKLSHIENLSDDKATARYTVRGKTEARNALTVSGKAFPINSDGEFSFKVTLKNNLNRHYIVVSNDQGMRRLITLDLNLTHYTNDGQPYYIDPPEPDVELTIPADGTLLTHPVYSLKGKTDISHQVEINGKTVPLDWDGLFNEQLNLSAGENTIQVHVTDLEGYVSTIERKVIVDANSYFFMAFADGKVSQLARSGFISGTGSDKKQEVVAEGRLAFYFKGWVKGKYLLTSAFDSGQNEINDLFSDLNKSQTERLLTNLDPEALYPVYGDESILVNDVESRGKFYLAIDSDTLQAKIGNFALQWQETELASYQRTLYGARIQYHGERSEKNDLQRANTETEFFISDANQVHVRDEILTTGGSLYYLSHAQVIEGSEQVTLVVRDSETGLVISRISQVQNEDYSIDYDQGRLLFNRPLSNISGNDRLANHGLLDGNQQTLQIDYEYEANATEQQSMGLRASQQLGKLRLGGTYLQDDLGTGTYTLQGVDAQIDLARHGRVSIEFANSRGVDGYSYQSEDGGLSFRQQRSNQSITSLLEQDSNQTMSTLDPLLDDTQSLQKSGQAWKINGKIDLGAWLANPDRYKVAFYAKQLDEGFISNGTFLEKGHQKAGVSLIAKLTKRNQLKGRYDVDNTFDIKGYNSLYNLQWSHQRDSLKIISEMQTQHSPTTDTAVAVVKIEKPWNDTITTSIEQQLTVKGEANNQTHLGVDLQATKHINLQAQVGMGNRGEAAQVGVAYDDGKRRMYLTEKASEDSARAQTQSTIVGTETQVGNGTVYNEHQWQRGDRDKRTLSILGSQQRWKIGNGFNLNILGEIGDIQAQNGSSKRYVAGVGLSFSKRNAWKSSAYLEWRRERGASARSQWLSKNTVEIKLDPDYTLLGKFNYSLTTDKALQRTEAAFEERSIGLAYRPIKHDKLNALGRYSYISDQRPLGLNLGEDRIRMSVASIDLSYDLTKKLMLTEKFAGRIKDDTVAQRPTATTKTTLIIHRLDYSLPKDFGIGSEYRTLAVDLTNDQRSGWLTEATWQANKKFKLGLGYNFTEFSDNLNKINDYEEKGWFFRIQGAW